MKMDVDMSDVGVTLDVLAHGVGETTEQATIRLGVAVARGVADKTQPRNLKTKARRKKKAAAGMRRVVEPVTPKYFTQMRRAKKPAIKLSGVWYGVTKDKLLNSVQEVWDAVERNRDQSGRTRKLAPHQKYFCRRSVYNKVATKRERLWGVAKGSWLGAGRDLARRQQGLNRVAIGKNFLRWAQRHMDKGRGRQQGRAHDTTAVLMSSAKSLRGGGALKQSDFQEAVFLARRGMFQYYKFELRRIRRMGGGRK